MIVNGTLKVIIIYLLIISTESMVIITNYSENFSYLSIYRKMECIRLINRCFKKNNKTNATFGKSLFLFLEAI